MRLSSHEISKQAAIWAFKLDAGSLAPKEQEALELWLAVDVRNLGALGRAIASLARVDRLGAVGVGALDYTAERDPTQWTRRHLVWTGAAATGLTAAAAMVGVAVLGVSATEDFVTRVGETCTLNLSDGSTIVLNTDSKLLVGFTKHQRRICLARGEALFHVAKDKTRPFIVVADDALVRAVGTSFNVRLLPQHPVQVLVQEGVVEVSQRNTPDIAPVRAAAGTRAVLAHDHVIATRNVDASQVTRDLAWQYGRLEFNNETLAAAADEYARYGAKITIDPAIADRTITGSFTSKDPVGFAKAAVVALDLKLEVKDNEVRISS